MSILNGIKNFLQFINDNWTMIVILIGLCIAVYKKVMNFINKSDEEKIEIAKAQIKDVILKWITDAEVDYNEWVKAGSIKRSEVIERIFEEYPILSQITDQESIIKWIDDTINEALEELRDIIEKNGGVPSLTTIAAVALPVATNSATVNSNATDSNSADLDTTNSDVANSDAANSDVQTKTVVTLVSPT